MPGRQAGLFDLTAACWRLIHETADDGGHFGGWDALYEVGVIFVRGGEPFVDASFVDVVVSGGDGVPPGLGAAGS